TATKRTFTKNTTFHLPIQMDEKVRVQLREVQLYVKSGASDWVRQEVVTPTTPYFTYRDPQDGEYLFTLVTVDKQGKVHPADVNTAPPALRVVVDTRPPVIETMFAVENNDTVLRVNVLDSNPDMQSVRAFVVTEQGERHLTPIKGQGTAFHVSPNDLNLPMRV